MADLSGIYDFILNPNGGVYKGAGPDVVYPSSSGNRVTAEGLNVRSVPTYGVDRYGSPITPQSAIQAQGNGQGIAGIDARVAQALSYAAAKPNQPAGSVNYGKSAERMAQNAYDFDPAAFGYSSQRPSGNPAVQVAEALAQSGTTPLPRRRPNIEANPGTLVPTKQPDTGLLGVKMSPGMNRNLAALTAIGGIPGVMQRAPIGVQPVGITVRGGNKTQQALAQVAAATQSAPQAAPAVNYAYSQTATGDGQGNNAFSSGDGYWGGARSLTE